MSKPDLSLYVGRRITRVLIGKKDAPWKWGIELEGGVVIWNKSAVEVFHPGQESVGGILSTMSMSPRDTTLHFRMANGHMHRISFNPTQYTISDPVHGGEVFPQWPEELEVIYGIPAMEDGPLSDRPKDEKAWQDEEARLRQAGDARVQNEAAEFLNEEANDA
jgi:hypothetical protein